MRPRLIILVRHGQSQANVDISIHRTVPDHKIKLTPLGIKQAKEAGQRLVKLLQPEDTVQFYTSPYTRARETFEYMSTALEKDRWKIKEEPRLREQDWGNFQAPLEEMQRIRDERAKYGHFFYRIPHGESGADVYDRISTFQETLHRAFASQNFPSVLVIVAHGLLVRLFVMRWFHWPVEKFESLENLKSCEFVIMEKDDTEKYRLLTEFRQRIDEDVVNGWYVDHNSSCEGNEDEKVNATTIREKRQIDTDNDQLEQSTPSCSNNNNFATTLIILEAMVIILETIGIIILGII